jgi:RNA polymerase sigma-70 factor, ECF subfamily
MSDATLMPGGFLQTLPWQKNAQVDVAPVQLADTLTDEACMVRYQQGDAAAFRMLYARYRDRLHRYVLRLANRSSEAEEVFQEVWLTVIRSKDAYRPTASFAAWLFSIAHRRAADRWRSLSRHAPDARHPVDEEALLSDDQHRFVAHETPEHQAHNDDLRQALLEAIRQLPLPQREAFLLRAEGELSVEDIAVITGVSRETAKSRMRYAQRRLREAMETWR